MSHEVLLQLAGILILGICAQWIAWRIHLPSILLLLTTGIIVGPVTGLLQPDILFGDLLLPLVSLCVAVILYEGGLNLKIRELKNIGGAFFLLITVGVVISWLVGSFAAHYILEFRWPVAFLLGSILVVTGPTVIGPILRHLRLRGKVAVLLKWEGIVIDPLGAILAVLVFTVVQAGAFHHGISEALHNLGLTLIIGMAFGMAAAGIVILALSRYWIPDFLHNPVSLMVMILGFAGANLIQEETGLLVVTVMGIALTNQKWVAIRHIIEFKEILTVLLISFLFIILAAQLRMADLRELGWGSMLFIGVMMLVARPLSVWTATIGSSLTWQERCFLSCLAPRGIVAAAVTSIFSLSLIKTGYPRAVEMVAITFLLIFVTVLVYGVSARPLARQLKLVQVNPQGILFIGAHSWVRTMALALAGEGYPVFLIDTNWENIGQCRMAGLPCQYGSALAEKVREEINFTTLGRMLAVTSNNEVNSLACLRYAEDFGRQEVYQLPFSTKEGRHESVPQEHRGRFLFDKEFTFDRISDLISSQTKIKKTKITRDFDYQSFRARQEGEVVPLFIIRKNGSVQVCTVNGYPEPVPEDVVFSIVKLREGVKI